MQIQNDPVNSRALTSEFSQLEAEPRLIRRATQLVEQWATHPGLGFPEVFSTDSELEAAYRFFNNPRIHFESLVDAQIQQTLRRIGTNEVLCIHDTTKFRFGG